LLRDFDRATGDFFGARVFFTLITGDLLRDRATGDFFGARVFFTLITGDLLRDLITTFLAALVLAAAIGDTTRKF
jgi:hypothetical protein